MELAIVLALVGVVLAALWGVVGLVRENIRREEAMEQMSAMVTKIRDHFLSRSCASTTTACPSPTLDLTDSLIDNNVLLPEQYRKGTNPRLADHPWSDRTGGGTLVVWSVGNGREFFSVEMNRLNPDACAAMATKLTGIGAPPDYTALAINGVAVAALPVGPETALGSCNNAGEANMVTVTYRLRP